MQGTQCFQSVNAPDFKCAHLIGQVAIYYSTPIKTKIPYAIFQRANPLPIRSNIQIVVFDFGSHRLNNDA